MVEWVVVCEAEGDFRVVTGLADRVASDPSNDLDGWIGTSLDSLRVWRGLDDSSPYLSWKSVKGEASRRRLQVHGYGSRAPGPDDAEIRKMWILVSVSRSVPVRGFILSKDTDQDADRRQAIEAAIQQYHANTRGSPAARKVCLALAHPEIEAWLLNGYVPDASERERHEEVKREIGRDPCFAAETLNPKREVTPEGQAVKRSTKRILNRLTKDDPARARRCWEETDLATLRARGENTGLKVYLDHIKEHFVPTLGT